MEDILNKIARCIQSGKIDKVSPYPPDMKGEDGADELTKLALESGIKPDQILDKALIPAMEIVGDRFSRKEIYVPQMLMSAKAMNSAMKHLKPFFQSGETKRKGKFIIGTVAGDLHDIGKNLVSMMIEGGGWEVPAHFQPGGSGRWRGGWIHRRAYRRLLHGSCARVARHWLRAHLRHFRGDVSDFHHRSRGRARGLEGQDRARVDQTKIVSRFSGFSRLYDQSGSNSA